MLLRAPFTRISCSESNFKSFSIFATLIFQSLFGHLIYSLTNQMLDRLGDLGPLTVFLLRSWTMEFDVSRRWHGTSTTSPQQHDSVGTH